METPSGSPRELPFLDGLLGYAASGVIPFHTPGHKQGRGAYGPLAEALGPAVRLDVSDVLSAPQYGDSWTEALRAAERLAARTFGARRTRFVVNGTSGAIHAMFLAARMLGYRQVVLPRWSHLSAFAGLILSGLEPVYLYGTVLPAWRIPLPPGADAYRAALAGGPAVLFATHPTYYGVAPALRPLAQLAERTGGLLAVDEAHGPHFAFHPALPQPALAAGAHLVAQSTHKLLGALTQSSMLHVGTDRVPEHVVEHALLMTQSTSPSGLLLASLDAARAQAAEGGERLWERAVALAAEAHAWISRLGMPVLSASDLPPGYAFDRTRLVIQTAGRGLHGVEAARRLRRLGVQVEMADPWNVVALITWADDEETVRALCEALRQAAASAEGTLPVPEPSVLDVPAPQSVLSPREAALAPSKLVPRAQAVGRVSAETVCPYPPGVPVICPGELVDADVLAYLDIIAHGSFEIRGAADPTLERLLVVQA